MQRHAIDTDGIFCNTRRCWAAIERYAAGAPLRDAGVSEAAVCVLDGTITLHQAGGPEQVGAHHGVQIPLNASGSVTAGPKGARVLHVGGRHPGFPPDARLLPALGAAQAFEIGAGQFLVYTDHLRGGVLTFAPGMVADRHMHEGADEIFWFLEGRCRVVVPSGETVHGPGDIVVVPAGDPHVIANASDRNRLMMFFLVTPNRVPSHTYFSADGSPVVRSNLPLASPPVF